jgi:hypothetical protein
LRGAHHSDIGLFGQPQHETFSLIYPHLLAGLISAEKSGSEIQIPCLIQVGFCLVTVRYGLVIL